MSTPISRLPSATCLGTQDKTIIVQDGITKQIDATTFSIGLTSVADARYNSTYTTVQSNSANWLYNFTFKDDGYDSTNRTSLNVCNGGIVIGSNLNAVGNQSFALGYINTACGDKSTALGGVNNTAYACGSVTIGGQNNNACGVYSIVGGLNNNTTGSYSLIVGNGNTSNYNNTVILGSNIVASQSDYVYVDNISSRGIVDANVLYANEINLVPGANIIGDVTIYGSLTALSGSTFVNTSFTTTSALSIVSVGVGPALYVKQAIGGGDVASFYDTTNDEVLHIGNDGFIGVFTGDPNERLTVKGNISSCGTVYTPIGNSDIWTNTYTTVNFTSGCWFKTDAFLEDSNLTTANTSNIAACSGISIGALNRSCGLHSFAIGFSSLASCDGAVAIGSCNTSSAYFATVGGGRSNIASNNYTVVGGGFRNFTTGSWGAIGGGRDNTVTASGNYTFIGGGFCNTASGTSSIVGGGQCNRSFGNHSTIAGGCSSQACTSSFIGGGLGNSATNTLGVIGGGCRNCINTGTGAVIGGGYTNTAEQNTSFIGSGQCNRILGTTGSSSTITGGFSSQITANGFGSFVGSGECHSITNCRGAIGGGFRNTITGDTSVVGGGCLNLAAASMTFIGGGCCNIVCSPFSVIGGGGLNIINSGVGCNSVIGGGQCNNIASNAFYNNILGGCCNCASSIYTTIMGGNCNTASGSYSVVGGSININAGSQSIIAGGRQNAITCCNHNTIGGGRFNAIQGLFNTGTIGGGCSNTTCGNDTTIGGGCYNLAVANGATIPGGSNACAYLPGQQAYAAGGFTVSCAGEAQAVTYVLRQSATSVACCVCLALDGVNSYISPAANKALNVSAYIVGLSTGSTVAASFNRTGILRYTVAGGAVIPTGGVQTIGTDVRDATAATNNWYATLSTNGRSLMVVASAGTAPVANAPIRWVACVSGVEVGF